MATLRGSVLRITYRDDATQFTVAKLALESERQEATVVGRFPSLAAGEWLEVEGEWQNHPEFGQQFRVASHRKAPPATLRGIERYLSSGAVEGIGPKLAERLVAKFGEKTLEIIEKAPDRLLEVEGIGARKMESIRRAFEQEKEVRESLVFLEGLGVAPGTAAKIYRRYGGETVARVRENPYRLADEVFGIGFRRADLIAAEMGIGRDAPVRAKAAVLHLLSQAAAEGHLFLPESDLYKRAEKLDIPREPLERSLEELAASGEVVLEPHSPREPVDSPAPANGSSRAVYPSFHYRAEVEVAKRLGRLLSAAAPEVEAVGLFDGDALDDGPLQAGTFDGAPLTEEQLRAVRFAARPGGGLFVLTGGPGTGKTTALRAMVRSLIERGRRCLLAAPTGRAAKRLKEATGFEAKTIHRLLEYSGGEGGPPRFQRNERSPLSADAVIVDEASMIDLPLFYHLLRALPQDAKLILVGDADQLPSVGPGNILRDILEAPGVPSVRLSRVFRQAEASRIVVNAHRIRRGARPIWGGEGSDFFFLPAPEGAAAADLVCDLVTRRLPNYLRCDPKRDVQALSVVRRGVIGVDNLNARLQEALNPLRPGDAEVKVGAHVFRAGDRVMQVRNDYEKMVFNGDIGAIRAVDPQARTIEVDFPDREEPGPVVYESGELNQLALAYCTSVHKSQGSEYPAVVMPIHWVMPSLMNRNLLYTAVTRAKRLVVLVGREDALWAYVRNDRADRRYTRLCERLAESAACEARI